MLNFASEDAERYLEEVKAFATQIGARKSLEQSLEYLGSYGEQVDSNPIETRCTLSKDFAPHSFFFSMERRRRGEREFQRWFSGGLIYSGPSIASDGSFPSLTVSLDDEASSGSKHSWSVHT